MSERPVQLSEPIHEPSEAVKNLLTQFDRLYHLAGAVTRTGRFARSEQLPEGRERPMAVNVERAKILGLIKEARAKSRDQKATPLEREQAKNKIATLLMEAKLRDVLAEQYLTQSQVSVELPGLGSQEARTMDLKLPELYLSRELRAEPPVFLIPGISNDVECVGSLAMELAMQGRRVIVIGYPESYNGKVTPEFAHAVDRDAGIEPHVAFFKEAIEHLRGDSEQIELWGYSMGGPIVARILNDPEFQKRTKQAALLCPASSVTQSTASLKLGAASELNYLKGSGSSASLMMSTASAAPKSWEHLALRQAVFGSLTNRATKASDAWKGARVAEGGRIIVVACGQDRITKSSDMAEEFIKNPQIDVLSIPKGQHITPLVRAAEITSKVLEMEQE